MSKTVTTRFAMPIISAEILPDYQFSAEATELSNSTGGVGAEAEQVLDVQKNSFMQATEMLKVVTVKLNEFYEQLFSRHKEEIARLSVEIARKILARKINDKDYEIETIVEQTLQEAPVQEDIVIHLNPDDFADHEKAGKSGDLPGIKFVPDANVGRAECVLETPKGTIESSIENNLEKIGKALLAVE